MKKHFLQVKTIRRYFFSYLLLFFLPLIVLNAAFHFNYQKTLQEELIRNQHALLEKLQLTTEYEISKFKLISSQLTLNGFAADSPSSDPVKRMDLIRFLAAHKNVNPFLADIVIYYKESGLFYSSTSSYTKEYFQLLFENQPEVFEDLTAFFSTPDRLYTAPPSIRLPSVSNRQENISLVYPVSPNGLDTTALLFFFFPAEKLEDLCARYYDTSSTDIIIANQEGDILAVYGDNSGSISEAWEEIGGGRISASTHTFQDIAGRKCLITTSVSDSLGWSYLSCTEMDSALGPAISLRNQQFLFTLSVTLAGGLLILLCMYYNLRPLYRLIDTASGLSVPLSGTFSNELDRIGNMLSQLSTENLSLTNRLEDTKIAAKEYIISQLITGHALKREYLERSMVQTFLSPDFDRYAVFCIYFAQSSPLLETTRAELIDEVEAFSRDDIRFFCKEDHTVNTFVCIALMNHHTALQLSSILSAMKDSLNTFINGSLSFGVGNTYELMESLSQSYIEASTALDYRFIRGNNAVIFFSSVEENVRGGTSPYPADRIRQFSQALVSGNLTALEDSLNGIFSCLSQENASLFQARSICQDIIHIVAKAMPDIQADESDNKLLPNVFLVSRLETVDDILTTIKQLGYTICKRISASYDENNQILIENIKNFIKEKSCDPGFSQELLASHFHMALPNLSAFYKEHTGENINSTVTRLRMEKAEFLLSTTALSITQIAMSTGYDNVSSFIRRFKQIYHMPPGAWRETHS